MKYWDNICKIQQKQTDKGLKKYGQALEDNTAMTMDERLTYFEEELIDGLMYIEHIKECASESRIPMSGIRCAMEFVADNNTLEHQEKKLIEEVGEYWKEVMRFEDGKESASEINLLEEFSDIVCLMMQIAYKRGFSEEKIYNFVAQKLNRTIHQIWKKKEGSCDGKRTQHPRTDVSPGIHT